MTPALLVLGLLLACSGDDGPTPTDKTTPSETGDTGGTTPTEPTELNDPISMPLVPTLDPADAASAEQCESCHEVHVEEWSQSLHSYAIADPVYRALVEVRQQDFDGAQDRFCLACHTTVGSRGGEVYPGFDMDDLSPIAEEGVTCVAYHKVASVERVNNAGNVLDLAGPMRGPIDDPDGSAFHESVSSPLFQEDSPKLCGSCHDVIETSGLNLERPYEEFLESPSFEAGGRCTDCHMPKTRRPIVQCGQERDHSDHRFIGVDIPLEPGVITVEEEDALMAEIETLLTGSVQLDVTAQDVVSGGDQIDLVLSATNLIDAHNFPTGSTFIRQAWIEVVASDATGRELYSTGTLDANGDLRNAFSTLDPYGDDDLIVFSSTFIDHNGPPEIFSWRATELWHQSLQPLHARVFTLFVPTDESVVGPVTVRSRLRFRTHGPFLLRALGLESLVPRLHIVDIDVSEITVDIEPPAPI